MSRNIVFQHLGSIAVALVGAWLGSLQAGGVDPKIAAITPPDKIQWVKGPLGADTAVLAGDPAKPGMYVILVRWNAHKMSHPHFHPNDRYITVLSGTWWVGTGAKFDPASTVPVGPGTYVRHFAKQIHYDGAKDADCIIEIVGEGPETMTAAEAK